MGQTQISLRRDTTVNWSTLNPILAEGEIGIAINVHPIKFKIGDGTTHWNDLEYFFSSRLFSQSRAPVDTDDVDSNFHPGDFWIDNSVDDLYMAETTDSGNATWIRIVTNIANDINNATQLTSINSSSLFGFYDALSSALRSVLWSQMLSLIQTYLAPFFQGLDAELTALAGLTSAANKLPYFTGSGTASTTDLTAAGRALIDDADASAQRTTLGLGSVATLSSIAESNLSTSDVTTADVTSTKHGFAPKSPADATKFLNGATTPAYAQVKDSDLSSSDVTTNNVSSTKHGFSPKSPADATKFLNGATTPDYAQVKDSDLSTSDVTTNNVTSTKHGFTPKSPADATQFLNGASTPAFAQVKDSDLSTSDITTNDAGTSKHGFAPKATAPSASSWNVLGIANGETSYSAKTIREVLSADRTYYVRTDGSDSNTGLSNTSGAAFLTIQKAIDVIWNNLDIRQYNVTIQVADGTYTGTIVVNGILLGSGLVTLQGNSGTPSNVYIHPAANNDAILVQNGAVLRVQDMKIDTTTSGTCLRAITGRIGFNNLVFPASGTAHISAEDNGVIVCTASGVLSPSGTRQYSITGNVPTHMNTIKQGILDIRGASITVSASLTFTQFAGATRTSTQMVNGNTYSTTTATGTRYVASGLSLIDTNGGGANYFPGNSAGTTASGAQYI